MTIRVNATVKMTEGEVCLDYAKMAETQRQTQLDHAWRPKRCFLSENAIQDCKIRAVWLPSEVEFRRHLGNVG
jgi:hypothetical protein